MARIAYWRGHFDPNWTFVVSKMLTIGETTFQSGDEFDKSLVNTRRLRQMFESRKLARSMDDSGEQKDVTHRENVRRILIEAGVKPENIDDELLQQVADVSDGMLDDEIRAVIAAADIVGEGDDDITEDELEILMAGLSEAQASLDQLSAFHNALQTTADAHTAAPATGGATDGQAAAEAVHVPDAAAAPAPAPTPPRRPAPIAAPVAAPKAPAKTHKKK